MDHLTAKDRARLIRRSYWIQLLLNYRTMQGAGYLYILWPWLRGSEHRSNRVARASGYLNGHPVFSAFALGAMLRRMRDGDAERAPDEFDRWRESLAGPMGMTGDSLIWERWKPMVFAVAACAVLLTKSAAVWAVTAALCLLIYNLPLLRLRNWALMQGERLGKELLTLSSHPGLPRLRLLLNRAAAMIAGLVIGLGLFMAGPPALPPVLQFFAAFLTMLALLKTRISVAAALLIAMLASLLLFHFLQ